MVNIKARVDITQLHFLIYVISHLESHKVIPVGHKHGLFNQLLSGKLPCYGINACIIHVHSRETSVLADIQRRQTYLSCFNTNYMFSK